MSSFLLSSFNNDPIRGLGKALWVNRAGVTAFKVFS